MEELHPIGCFRLVQAVVIHVTLLRYGSGITQDQRVDRIRQLMASPILQHYCDVLGYDLERFQQEMAKKCENLERDKLIWPEEHLKETNTAKETAQVTA